MVSERLSPVPCEAGWSNRPSLYRDNTRHASFPVSIPLNCYAPRFLFLGSGMEGSRSLADDLRCLYCHCALFFDPTGLTEVSCREFFAGITFVAYPSPPIPSSILPMLRGGKWTSEPSLVAPWWQCAQVMPSILQLPAVPAKLHPCPGECWPLKA